MKEIRKKKILLGVGGILLPGLLLNQHSLTVQAESVNNPQSHRILTNTEDGTVDLLKTSSSEQNHSVAELISEVKEGAN